MVKKSDYKNFPYVNEFDLFTGKCPKCGSDNTKNEGKLEDKWNFHCYGCGYDWTEKEEN